MQFQIYRWYLGIVYCFRVSMPLFPPPQNPPRMTLQSSPHHSSRGRQGRGYRGKGYTLPLEYSLHATWEGWAYQMYI